MQNKDKYAHRQTDTQFGLVVASMDELYNHDITQLEAAEASRNLIGFCKTMLEIHHKSRQDSTHA